MSITHWPQGERPREKLMQQGASALSVAELLAILLRTGAKGYSAIDLARGLLNRFGSLHSLTQADMPSFCCMPGLGKTKYIQLQAALELNRRFLFEELEGKNTLENSLQTQQYFLAKLGQQQRETFACLFLNTQHHILGYAELFQGSLHQADIYPREVAKVALQHNAAAVIIAHNHPSGSLKPSMPDQNLTNQLKQALALIDIKLLDHIIVGHNKTLSFVEQGLL